MGEREIVVDQLETQRDLKGCGQCQGPFAWDLVSPRESLCCHSKFTKELKPERAQAAIKNRTGVLA